jgi:hypothetical protein
MSNTDDLLGKLDEPAAPAWQAEEPGDLIVGKIKRMSSRDAGYGEYQILTVEPERVIVGGEVVAVPEPLLSIHVMGQVFADKVVEYDPHVGGRVAARFDGMVTSPKSGNEYKAWSVTYEPPAPGSDLTDRLADDRGVLG